MKAVVYTQYGSPAVLKLQTIEKPAPGDEEVLVKVHATTVTVGDTIMRSFNLPTPRWQWLFARMYLGLLGPKRQILGMEISGTIEATGSRVTRFKVGDAVFASTFAADFGGYAEYKCLPQNGVIAIKPVNLSHNEAVAIPGAGMTALRCLRKANIQRGQKILIYGASGAVGTYSVQLARHFGADVTGVCSTANMDLVKSLGANKVLDYTQDDFSLEQGAYDIVFDAVNKLPPAVGKRALNDGGIYLNVHKASNGKEVVEDLVFLKDLIEAEKLKPVIDRTYSLEQIVEAHRYVDTGRKKGNVIVCVEPAEVPV